MKNYNKILEAVNKGIQLALDDYQDIEPNSSISQTNDIIDVKDPIKEIILRRDFVDLDLPSGTLWAKYNLGVDPKKLDKYRYWYGDYYQWGETCPAFNPLFDGYTFKDNINIHKFSSSNDLYGKRCYGINGLNELLSEDDPVFVKYRLTNYHTPSIEQFQELKDNTTKRWVKYYQGIDGLDGLLLRGKNGNEIFFPANGFIDIGYGNPHFTFEGTSPYIWSKNHRENNEYDIEPTTAHYGPYCLSYHNSGSQYDYISLDWMVREHAAGIRAVYNEV